MLLDSRFCLFDFTLYEGVPQKTSLGSPGVEQWMQWEVTDRMQSQITVTSNDNISNVKK